MCQPTCSQPTGSVDQGLFSKSLETSNASELTTEPQETYDYLKPSEEYTEALDEKLVVNRVFGKIRRKHLRPKESSERERGSRRELC